MNSAVVPQQVEDVQGDGRWMSMHRRFVSEAHEKEPDVLFVGDSLVQHLQFTKLWSTMFTQLHCLNFGVGADQTQNVLWRIQNGELEGISPKVIVVLIGTNNHGNTAEEVAEGIIEIINAIHDKQTQASIIVLGLPPRGEKPNKLREKNAAVNSILAEKLSSHQKESFLTVDPKLFVSSDGTISPSDMYDYLHLTEKGYQKLCEPLLDELQDQLGMFIKAGESGDT